MTKNLIFFYGALLFFSLLVGAIWFFGRNWVHVPFLPDQGPLWYYWKLPEPTFWPRFTGWSFFLLHLFISWFILYKAKREKERAVTAGEAKYGELKWYNYALLVTHMFFGVLHLIQTSIWYDTLAHDTPVWLSQYSVILMLVLIMILVNSKRGLFFGYKLPIPQLVVELVRKYHSYYILLALIFTFWYHPMEITPGHLIGFFYMFLLMLQSTLLYTKQHLSRYWIFILEIMVLFHGTTVAIGQGTATRDVWPLFAFGFGLIAVCTQIYLLALPKWANISLQIMYVLSVLAVYSGNIGVKRTYSQLYELSFIPVTEYGIVLILAGIGAIATYIIRKSARKPLDA